MAENLRIAVLGTRGFPGVQGGIETHCENLYPRLAGMGCDIFIFTRKPYVDVAIEQYKGVRLIPLSCIKSKYLEAFLHTFYGVFAAKKINPDILHIHAIGPSLFVPIARLLGLKIVMTNHGPDYERKKWKTPAKFVLRLGERLGSKWSNAIICISERIAEDVRRKYGRHSTVIHNGVIIPQPSNSDEILKKYGLMKGKYVLSVGRLVPEKGFHDLIEAFTKIRLEGWMLVIAGGADHADAYSFGLKEKASRTNNVVMTGFLSGKPLQEIYSHAGLFVLPSYYEGLPIALLEAMSYGLSCIASDIPANRIAGLEEGRYFVVSNIMALSAKIMQFIDTPFTHEQKVRQLKMVADKFDWNKIAEETLKIYESVKIIGRKRCQINQEFLWNR